MAETVGHGNPSEALQVGGVGQPVVLGSSTSKVALFGGTVTSRPSVTWPNTATATTTLNELKANRLMAALVKLNLIVTT